MPSVLQKIGLRHAPLSNRIVLARFGKDPHVALETRDAQSEFWATLIEFGFGGKMPAPGEGVEIKFGGENDKFTCTLKRTA